MIKVVEQDSGVKMLDVETYLNNFNEIRISDKVKIRVGKVTLKDMAEFQAKINELDDVKKKAEKDGTPLNQELVFGNMIDQVMILLQRDNPDLQREVFESLPVGALNHVYKFILKEGMGLGEGLGKEPKVAETPTISA